MSRIQRFFTEIGYTVLFIPETATELITGGVAPWTCGSNTDYQTCQLRLQLEKERVFEQAAQTMDNQKVLIVCDRGALDNKGYMEAPEFAQVLRTLQTNEIDLRDNYDAVFHLVTAAKGAAEFYTTANNTARSETPEEAAELDDKLIAAWTGHPHLRVIDNSSNFEVKINRLLSEISSFLGEPRPVETGRKFLIKYPDIQALEKKPNCQAVDIMQAYLRSEVPGEFIRIRQRGQNGNYIYFKTRKRRITDLKRVEVEERLSQEEYLSLLVQADPAYRPIHKQRYCLSDNGLYYEIDVYPEWQDKALMEVELHSDTQQVVFPDCVKVIREVTDDPSYTNHSLARL
jgi:CYTH domain-containing protein